MKILAGLGNPGLKYELTRHNAGFIILDNFAEKHGFSLKKVKFKSVYEKVRFNGEDLILLKPQTYMNKSGEAIREAADFFKVDNKDIIVIYDDIDLDLGRLRVKAFGSSGHHNGMRSIINHLGGQDFPRIRIGISKPPPRMDLADYVLGKFTDQELRVFNKLIDHGVGACEVLITDGPDKAMNIYNGMEV